MFNFILSFPRNSRARIVNLLHVSPIVVQQQVMAVDESGRTVATTSQSLAPVWKARFHNALLYMLDLLSVFAIYLLSELVIWGLSRPLSLAHIQFFSSVMGMILVFILMLVTHFFVQSTDGAYFSHIRSKVDFINSHLGIGFPIPIVMLDEAEILKAPAIARIIGNFLVTNLVSWIAVFLLSIGLLKLVVSLVSRVDRPSSTPTGSAITILGHEISPPSTGTTAGDKESRLVTPASLADPATAPITDQAVTDFGALGRPALPTPQRIGSGNSLFVVPLSFFLIFALGVPIAVTTGDQRVLDGLCVWCVWISSVRLQKNFKTSGLMSSRPRGKNILATLMNPVLITTLTLTAYTRIKASASGVQLIDILKHFSGGSPLYALWTAKVIGHTITRNPTGWFGAGDAALSLLECGLLVWGFKLYECRRQLFSKAGLCTVLIAIVSAAGNVFLCTLAGRGMGLAAPESLAFSARSVTLALSKPAMQIIGGNVAVNAALVVSNGILGQLMYPFVLHRLGVSIETQTPTPPPAVAASSASVAPLTQEQAGPNDDVEMDNLAEADAQQGTTPSPRALRRSLEELLGDNAATIAAGVTVGINGAAMGVAYLYATNSRAAPYAALSMTVFGVMTVVFTTVQPFQGILIGLAHM
ncbi:hypothetical protein HJFPF1_02591 [Paramyrothecium foliicola]|nr:hypothetical protein HJFPF1_02591 [Paramyrothecium foliicola]